MRRGFQVSDISSVECEVLIVCSTYNQEKYLAKLAGEYDVGSTSGRGFVHFVTSAARARLALDE